MRRGFRRFASGIIPENFILYITADINYTFYSSIKRDIISFSKIEVDDKKRLSGRNKRDVLLEILVSVLNKLELPEDLGYRWVNLLPCEGVGFEDVDLPEPWEYVDSWETNEDVERGLAEYEKEVDEISEAGYSNLFLTMYIGVNEDGYKLITDDNVCEDIHNYYLNGVGDLSIFDLYDDVYILDVDTRVDIFCERDCYKVEDWPDLEEFFES